MKLEFYDMLIGNAKEASQRARWIFTVAIVISLVQLGAAYNFGYSETRDYVEDLVFRQGLPATKQALPPQAPALSASAAAERGVGQAALKELRTAMVKSWVDEQTFHIGLLGIRMHAADAGLVGSFAFIAVSVWLFYAVRRENVVIANTIDIAGEEPPRTRAYVFHALVSSQMFATLQHHGRHAAGAGAGAGAQALHLRMAPGIAAVLTFLPAITLAAVIAFELLSVFRFAAVFRGYDTTLYALRGLPRFPSPFWLALVVEALALCIVLRLCWLTHSLQRDTRQRLQGVSTWDVTSPEPESPAEVSG